MLCFQTLTLAGAHAHRLPAGMSKPKIPLLGAHPVTAAQILRQPATKKKEFQASRYQGRALTSTAQQPPPDAFRAQNHPAAPFPPPARLQTAAPGFPSLGPATTRGNSLRYLRHNHHSAFVPITGTRGASHQLSQHGSCVWADLVGAILTGVLWGLSFFVSLPSECIFRSVV